MLHRFCALAVLSLFAVSCSADDSPTEPESDSPVATTVSLSSATLSFVALGASQLLTATVKDQNGVTLTGATVTWASSDEAIVTVSSAGLATSVDNGSATITASSGTASGSVSVTVEQVAAALALSPSSVSFASLGDTVRLAAVVTDAAGTTISDATVTWASSDEAIATVSSTGLVTSVSSGSATVTASSGATSGSASVTIEQVVASLEITNELPSFLTPGATFQLQAVALDMAGLVVSGVTVAWTSSDPAVASVSPSGVVSALAEGTSTITATVLTISSSAPLTVTTRTTLYDVVFESTWSASTHPASFPTNAHFSGLIGGTHGPDVTFWAEDSLASEGIKNMAELGSKTALSSEVAAAIQAGTADGELSGGGLSSSPGSVELAFQVNVDFSLVTLVSMIAPSPDWFVGVSSLSLLEEGSWVSSHVVQLFAYDAGTDSGVIYTSPNAATEPRANIARILVSPFDVASPLGTFTFTRRTGG